MKAFNLFLDPHPDSFPQTFPDDAPDVGWVGTDGPAVAPEQWPRSPLSGLPMLHGFTLLLPQDYRTQGPEYVAISFFQGDGEFVSEDTMSKASASSDDPYLRQLAEYSPHPMLQERVDILDQPFAFIWLTQAEYDGGPTAPPTDVRRPGEHRQEESPSAWDTPVQDGRIRMTERTGDPNVGHAPNEDGEGDYQDPWADSANKQHGWADALWEVKHVGHLGGTSFPVQAMPENLSPYYLEFDEFGGLNFGTGAAQLDLKTDTFDWACG